MTAADLGAILAQPDLETVDTKLVRRVGKLYEDFDLDLEEFHELLEDQEPSYVNGVYSTLARIAGIEGAQELIRAYCETDAKAQGAEFQMQYVVEHLDAIARIEVPVVRFRRDGTPYEIPGTGIDLVTVHGTALELKAYDFTNPYYAKHADAIAGQIAHQSRERLKHGCPRVEIIFASGLGNMPSSFRDALDRELAGVSLIQWRME